jgi:exo-beta-1,3-glucanase (GH17 family)
MNNFTIGRKGWRTLLASLCLAALAACGGGGSTPDTHNAAVRPLSADFTQRKAVAYSPYRTAVNEAGLAGEQIPDANIKQDLDLLVGAGFGLIRLFDSDDKVAKATLRVISQYKIDLKVQLGVYLQSSNDGFNQAQLARAAALANTYKDTVLAVSVGNENMVSWSFNPISPETMASYLKTLRGQISQPLTSDDNYAYWAGAGNSLVTDQIDFASLHTYPELDSVYAEVLWDWRQRDMPAAARANAMMDAAIGEARRQYQTARDHLDRMGRSDLPITIGETGWNAVNLGALNFRAHPVNQKMYYDRLAAWAAEGRKGAGPKAVIYFEAFDEPWKQGDDKWGLFNVKRQARYVIKDLVPSSLWVPAGDASEPATASLTAADAVYFVPPVVNAAVTQDRYVVFADAVAGSEMREAGLVFDPFVKTFWQPVTDFTPGDGPQAYEIDPRPETWGWGMLYQSRAGVTTNLSNYANGNLHLSIKTTYPGKIEIGLISDTQTRAAAEAYLQIAPGTHGYANDGAWHEVVIPLKEFVAQNPKLDLSLISGRFVIADRYAFTGNAAGNTTKIKIDAIYWTK